MESRRDWEMRGAAGRSEARKRRQSPRIPFWGPRTLQEEGNLAERDYEKSLHSTPRPVLSPTYKKAPTPPFRAIRPRAGQFCSDLDRHQSQESKPRLVSFAGVRGRRTVSWVSRYLQARDTEYGASRARLISHQTNTTRGATIATNKPMLKPWGIHQRKRRGRTIQPCLRWIA